MPNTMVGQFSDRFASWLASEGFWISQNRDGACANMIDFSGCRWMLSIRATSLVLWTLVVVFDPDGEDEEVFYDLDAPPEYIIRALAAQLHDIWDDSPLV